MKKSREDRRPRSAAALMGRMVGAVTALPAACGVFLTAALAGVPAGVAVTRSVVSGALVWIVVSLAVRILFTFVIRDWERSRAFRPSVAKPEDEGETEAA